MCRTGLILILLLSISSCKKEEEIPVISFSLKLTGFEFTQAYADSPEEFSAFEHHLSGGVLRCEGEGQSYSFSFEKDSLETTVFELPAGDYRLSIGMDRASLYGQPWATFQLSDLEVYIGKESTQIELSIEPDCAVFLVQDVFQKLDQGAYMIEKHAYANGFFTAYPLSEDTVSGLYYTYFTPDTDTDDPSAFLWFYEGEPGEEEGGLPTANLESGTRYDIEILY